MIDDGSIFHRGEGKSIINGCTDGSKERSLHEEMHQYGVFEGVRNINVIKFNNKNRERRD